MQYKQIKFLNGSYYIETAVALLLLGLMISNLMPYVPRMLKVTRELKVNTNLILIAEYTGNYVFRWVNFGYGLKYALSQYEDGDELERSSDRRFMRLSFLDSAMLNNKDITDHYKVSITLWERSSRDNSSVVRIKVWYDTNLNNLIDNHEKVISFSTVITEKQQLKAT